MNEFKSHLDEPGEYLAAYVKGGKICILDNDINKTFATTGEAFARVEAGAIRGVVPKVGRWLVLRIWMQLG